MITKPQTLALRLLLAMTAWGACSFPAVASAPSAPTNLAATATLESQVSLSWTAVSGATSYNIYRGTSSGSETEVATNVPSNTYEDSNLNFGQTYYYEVTAVSSGAESGKSGEKSAITKPALPTNLTLTPGDSQVKVAWTASPSATSYKVYRDSLGGATGAASFVVTGASYTDTGLINGTPYYYEVAPINASGENPQTAPTPLPTATPVAGSGSEAPVGSPTSLAAVAGTGQVQLRWQPISNATNYDIFRGTSSNSETLWHSSVTSNTFTDTGLTNGATLYYKVRGDDGSQTGSLSAEVSATPNLPGAPSTPTVTTASGEVVLNWTATGTSYAVYRGFTSGSETLLDSGLTGNTYTDASVVNGTTYYYKIQELNAGGSSTFSSEVTALPTGPAAQSWSGTINFSLPGEPVQSCTASIPDINRPVLAAFLQPEGNNMQAIAKKYNAISLSIDGYLSLSPGGITQYNFGTAANPIHLNTSDDSTHVIDVIDYRWPQLSALRIQAALTAAAGAVSGPSRD